MIQHKIPSITCLATVSALNAVENKTLNVKNLLEKADHDAKTFDNEDKYFTKSEYNKFMSEILDISGFDESDIYR